NAPPFAGATLKQKLAQHLKETPRPLEQVNPGVPPALAKLVGYLMAKDPELRYQKAESVVEGLLAHIPPDVAQTQLKPPTRASQKYEKWLAEHNPLAQAEALQAAVAADAASRAHEAAEFAAAEALDVAPAVPSATPAPMHVTPVGAIPTAAPAIAVAVPAGIVAPVASAIPVGAIPVGAVPVGAIPVGAIPVGAVPVAAAIPVGGAMPAVATAAPVFPAETPQFAEAAFPAASTFDAPAPAAPVAPGGRSLGERARLARQRKRMVTIVVAAIVVISIGTAAGLHFAGVFDLAKVAESLTSSPQPMPEPGATAAKSATTAPVVEEPEAPKEPIAGLDDGIWGSPTNGKPLDLKYLALGMQAVAAIRPADILKHPEGKPLLAPDKSPALENLAGGHPLGTLGHWVQNTLPGLVGAPLEKIEQVIVGWPESGGESGTIAVVAHLSEPVDESALMGAWGNPEPMEAGAEKFFKRDAMGYYVPKAEGGRVVVVAPVDEIQESINGSVVLWAMPEPEKLLQSTDSDRHFTFLMPTRFLETAGKSAFEGRGARLQSAVDWLLRGDADSEGNRPDPPKAVAVSAHLAPDGFFAEARLFDAAATAETTTPAEPIRDRVRHIPKAVKLFKADLLLTPFSKAVLVDLDDKVKAWEQETRFGTGDKQVVVRSYLPPNAGLHLALGAHLCTLESLTGGMFVQGGAPAGGAAPGGNQAQTAADKLKKITSLSFPRNTLEVSMQLLADDLGVPVVILGSDLQLEGITKNQSFGLEEKDKPAMEIFKTIFARANPDGKLVYIIKPDDSGVETIFVTTRAAVAKRGDKLPPEFAK
ncbi:MAG TPA: hypothetical protein VG713_21775, partial [Pirellulales bacterium]|nr:hypothetical protein [Pirellulales bacterium]